MPTTRIHPKVTAAAAAGIVYAVIVATAAAFGIHADERITAAAGPLLAVLAGYAKRGPVTLGDVGLSVSTPGPTLTLTSAVPVNVAPVSAASAGSITVFVKDPA